MEQAFQKIKKKPSKKIQKPLELQYNVTTSTKNFPTCETLLWSANPVVNPERNSRVIFNTTGVAVWNDDFVIVGLELGGLSLIQASDGAVVPFVFPDLLKDKDIINMCITRPKKSSERKLVVVCRNSKLLVLLDIDLTATPRASYTAAQKELEFRPWGSCVNSRNEILCAPEDQQLLFMFNESLEKLPDISLDPFPRIATGVAFDKFDNIIYSSRANSQSGKSLNEDTVWFISNRPGSQPVKLAGPIGSYVHDIGISENGIVYVGSSHNVHPMVTIRIENYDKMIVSTKNIMENLPTCTGGQVCLGVAIHRGKLYTTSYSDHRLHCFRINLISQEFLLFFMGFVHDENSTTRLSLLRDLIVYIGLMEYYHCYG